MAWVRYDDQFHVNAKVTAVIFDDPGAIALHALANTWTNGQKHKGYVPAHQPGVLLCDKEKGRAWAAILVKHRLWHEVGTIDCEDCLTEYSELPPFEDGYVFHNSREYRAPARDRLSPGTAADLSEKRREAGRRGGLASAAKRNRTNASTSKQTEAKRQATEASEAKPEAATPKSTAVAATSEGVVVQVSEVIRPPAETQQTAQANQANGASKASKLLLAGVSPVPVPEPLFASNEAKVPPTAGTAEPRPEAEVTAGDIVGEWIDLCAKRPPNQVIGQIGKHVKAMLAEGIDPEDVRLGLATWTTRRISASQLPGVVNDVMNGQSAVRGPQPGPARSTTDERVAQAQALKAKFRPDARQPNVIRGETLS